MLLATLLILAACSHRDTHPEWPEAWSRAGDHFAIETPDGYYLYEYNPAFAANGIWYMTWAFGQPGTSISFRTKTARPKAFILTRRSI